MASTPDGRKIARFAEHPPYHLYFASRYRLYLMTSQFVQPSWSTLAPLDSAAAESVLRGAAAEDWTFERTLRRAFPVELGPVADHLAIAPVAAGLVARRQLHLVKLDPPPPAPPARIDAMTLDVAPPPDRSFFEKIKLIIVGIQDVPAGEFGDAAIAEVQALVAALALGGALKMAVRIAGVIAAWVALHVAPVASVAAVIIDVGMISYAVYQLGFAAFQFLEDFSTFIGDVQRARSNADLKPLSVALARLLMKIGVTVLMTMLIKAIEKKAKQHGDQKKNNEKSAAKDEKSEPIPGKTEPPASAPVGRRAPTSDKADRQLYTPKGPPRNPSGVIDGRTYSGHAFDRMQDRGLTPSVVEETIRNGTITEGRGGTSIITGTTNSVTVIIDKLTGNVVTAY